MTALYSIGYGNRSWQSFLNLLVAKNCEFLIDVRSSPYSKFNQSFSRESLLKLCKEAGIRYVFMGDTLGGKPSSDEYFDSDGKIDYIKLSETREFQVGISRLITANNKKLVSFIMCSELRPQDCHRSKLIGTELKERGVEIVHIDESGKNVNQEEVIARLTGGQDDIFGSTQIISRSRGSYAKAAK
ncbi:DUF488 domain-containing protein [Methylomonas sp. EFPC3]|uniref:DUF488 domain-containing protein n=1 Tax=Methylomonas sp. EFPC3 TaxID=3021710 RepID=UPI002415FC7C|nr:DUF488 domain-containing protein [Methylomonas sp. EFPC3]WFP49333.1 DUF488 domain-containing protein [Methylomonas sp. EFPC3]